MEKEAKKILVTRSFLPPKEEFLQEISDIWDSHWLTNMGPKHQKLEEGLKHYLGVEQLSLFTNGHMALELLLQAMNLSGEVITTPFTFVSTTHAIVRNGLTPVFCDINPRDFTIDVSKLESLITDKTSAIVPVHVYGRICQVEEIERIAKKYGLKVIYDAAHAFGVTYHGKGIGTWGDASTFSFHATKVFNTVEGGAIAFSNQNLYRTLYNLKNFGIEGEEIIRYVGANSKMSEFHAAMGLCNLRHVDEEMKKRARVDGWYREYLEGIPGIYLPLLQPEVKPNYSYFPVVFKEQEFGASRNKVYETLKQSLIFTRKYFYPLTSHLECYRGMYERWETPVAFSVSNRILALPMYGDLEKEEVEQICRIILSLKAYPSGNL